ncbi:MAG: hypothetical protein WD740_04895 [Anaerolineales bacterium]
MDFLKRPSYDFDKALWTMALIGAIAGLALSIVYQPGTALEAISSRSNGAVAEQLFNVFRGFGWMGLFMFTYFLIVFLGRFITKK